MKVYIMKMSDFSNSQQQNIIMINNNAFSLIPPTIKKISDLSPFIDMIEKSSYYSGIYYSNIENTNINEFIIDLLICREAAIAAQVNMINVAISELLVEVYVPKINRALPGNLRLAMNFYRALKFGLDVARTKKSAAFTIETFKQIHAICVDGLVGMGNQHQFRTEQTWVRGLRIENARLVPPPPAYIEKCMEDLVGFLNASGEIQNFLPLAIRIGLISAQLKAIQPFTDTATDLLMRVIIPMIGVAHDFPPVFMSNFLHNNMAYYFEYQVEQQLSGDWKNWLKFFLNGYVESIQEACAITKSIRGLQIFFEEALLISRFDSSMRKVLRNIIKCPAFTIQLLQKDLSMSYQTPNTIVADLVQRNVVHSIIEKRRNRIFITSGVVDILQGGHGLPAL